MLKNKYFIIYLIKEPGTELFLESGFDELSLCFTRFQIRAKHYKTRDDALLDINFIESVYSPMPFDLHIKESEV